MPLSLRTAFILPTALLFLSSSVAAAATFTVNSFVDGSDNNPSDGVCDTGRFAPNVECTLRAAVQSANRLADADEIVLPPGFYTLTTQPYAIGDDNEAFTGDLDILQSVTIRGTGANASETIIQSCSTPQLSGNCSGTGFATRVLHIFAGTVILRNLTIANGYAVNGGGIDVGGGNVTLQNVHVKDNGALAGGGLFIDEHVNATIQGSTFSGNFGREQGGAVLAWGNVLVRNSTISGNQSRGGGGYYVRLGTTLLDSVTLTANSVIDIGTRLGMGGGVYREAGTLQIRNSLIVGNSAPNEGRGLDCVGQATSLGYTLIGKTTRLCQWTPGTGDLPQGSTSLGPLRDNGGLTWTHALLPGASGVDAGDDANCPSTDQRGVVRPQRGRGSTPATHCDMGAFEAVNQAPVAVADDRTIEMGATLSLNVLANDSDPEGDPLTVELISAPTFANAFSLSSNGALSYTPPPTFSGVAMFSYRVNDGTLTSEIVTSSILVLPSAFVVNSPNDGVDDAPGDGVCRAAGTGCTLRAAIEEANALGGDRIIRYNGFSPQTSRPTLGELPTITANVTIEGRGAGKTILQACSTNQKSGPCTGTGIAGRVLNATGALTLKNLTINNGYRAGSTAADDGAGVRFSSALNIYDSVIENNATGASGGGLAAVGASATLHIERSVITGNKAAAGGGISMVSGSISNTTVNKNTGSTGAAGIAKSGSGNAVLINVTIAENTGGQGGVSIAGTGTLTTTNSIIASNLSGLAAPLDCSGALSSGGHNILGDTTNCLVTLAISDFVGDAQLGVFSASAYYYPLTRTSPAVNAGDNAVCAAAPVSGLDQSQAPRPRGAGCDIGASERALGTNSFITSMAVSAGSLSPDFNQTIQSYASVVDTSVDSVTVTAVSSAQRIDVRVGQGPYERLTSGVASSPLPLVKGLNNIEVVATAEDSSQRVYSVQVIRMPSDDSALSALALSVGTLTPAFDPDTLEYTAQVVGPSSVVVTPTVRNALAQVRVGVGGSTPIVVASGADSPPLPLAVGANVISLTVTAEDLSERTYTVTLTRTQSSDATLAALSLSAGSLAPSFAADTLAYSADVTHEVDTITAIALSADMLATLDLSVNGGPFVAVESGVASAPIALAVGITTLTLRVTAEDGTQQSYTVTVTRAEAPPTQSSDATLAALSLSAGELAPVFVAETLAYSADVTHEVDTITALALSTDMLATIELSVNSGPFVAVESGVASAPIPLAVGVTTLTLRVTAEDGTQQSYTVTVTRAVAPVTPKPDEPVVDQPLPSRSGCACGSSGGIEGVASIALVALSLTLRRRRRVSFDQGV